MKRWIRLTLISLVITYVGILIIAPLVALILGAFGQGIAAAWQALASPAFFGAFWRTLWIAVVVVLMHVCFGTAVAWIMVRHRFPGRELLNGLIDMPFAISSVVVGYMLLLIFGRNGLLGPMLASLDIQVAFAVPGMILATLFVTLPFMVRELIPVLENFKIEQELAAATLGARGWQTFFRVTLPSLRWGFIYGITLTFARALGEFGAVLVIGGGIQGRTDTTTLFIFRSLDERMHIAAYSAALALGLLAFILVMGTEVIRRIEKNRAG
ncbi:MAG: sulfate ABC transporter permease subunit [Anaerolineaceae bacterium]|jgi:sulfate transport system permease protein